MDVDTIYDTIVIGGGQAGLATGYHLKRLGRSFVVLDGNARSGDSWRNRWDCLRLFTPARYSALPGMAFPGPGGAYPSKDDMADYLEAYAKRFDLPVRTDTAAKRLDRRDGRFIVTTADDGTVEGRHVIVATGLTQRPPPFAHRLHPSVQQFQALDGTNRYRNPRQLPDGPALVVGAGNSGAEIAMDLAPGRRVWLSGRDTGRIPLRALRLPPFWWAVQALNADNRLGRKLVRGPQRGTPLVRVRSQDLANAGVERIPRSVDAHDRSVILADGRRVQPAAVIWCNGPAYRTDWINLPILDESGRLRHRRGLSDDVPGLGFVGLPFQHSLGSGLIKGMIRDAAHVAENLHR
ncbi:MAG TPA: NAD(P)/FAD-dependent oxidoreductase [Nonomuraea sp.]|nr:NAD(P)/FAD-dependent oxidoreductase [Nonomuraea sp.]